MRRPREVPARRLQFRRSINNLWEINMTPAPQTTTPNEELHKDLVDLGSFISALPAEMRSKAEPIFARVVESTKRRRRILTLVQDALGQLRLDMKYLVFDLEATRRERDAYRKLLEDQENAE